MRKFFKKLNKEFFTVLLIGALFLIGRTNNVFAAEETYDIRIEAKSEDKSLGIFNEEEDGLWYPGRTLPKQFLVKNNSGKEIQFNKFSVTVQPLSDNLINKIFNFDDQLYKQFSKYLKVTLKDENSVYYNGCFDDLSSKGVELSAPMKVSPNSQKEFTLILSLDETTGNDFQNLTHKFNVAIQYTLTDESSGVDTQIPPTDNNTGGGETGNQTGGQTGNNTGGNQTGNNAGGNQTDNNSGSVQTGAGTVNLPQTGRFFDFSALLFLGMMLAAAGFFLLGSKSKSFIKIFKARGVK